jgi:hypothetical protein|tara:strand:- start:409 stop:978 length:570 start_codon:yes stop_codon:yes gene_type:complete
MAILYRIPTFNSGDYKNLNAYFDESTTRGQVQYKLNPKVEVTPEDGVYTTILGTLTTDNPYADYTSAYVKTFINLPFKNNVEYDQALGEITTTNQGTVTNQTPPNENNPVYMAQPTYLTAMPGRDTLVLDPKTKMLTNTRVAQAGITNNRTNNTTRNNNQNSNSGPVRQNTTTGNRSTGGSSMGSSGGY